MGLYSTSSNSSEFIRVRSPYYSTNQTSDKSVASHKAQLLPLTWFKPSFVIHSFNRLPLHQLFLSSTFLHFVCVVLKLYLLLNVGTLELIAAPTCVVADVLYVVVYAGIKVNGERFYTFSVSKTLHSSLTFARS